jgi:hypothetical protein
LAAGIPAGLTPREGRKFGLTVGAAFLVLAAISRWRGHTTTPLVLGGLGAALVLAGGLLPGRLAPVHRAWMQLALLLSKVTTPVFMGLIYFVVLTPTGLLIRLFGRNPLKHRPREGSYWVTRPAETPERNSLTRQF